MSDEQQESLGISVIREIARQDMIKAIAVKDGLGVHNGQWVFRWAANAPEQLEAAIIFFLRARGYEILKVEASPVPSDPTAHE